MTVPYVKHYRRNSTDNMSSPWNGLYREQDMMQWE